MRLGNPLNESMGAKHAELTTQRRGAPSPFALRKSLGSRIQQALQIAVAKAVEGELATMNGLQQYYETRHREQQIRSVLKRAQQLGLQVIQSERQAA